MKISILTLTFLVSAFPALADSAVPPVNGETEIENAFQREYAYLAAQREALVRQRNAVESKTTADLTAGKRQLQEFAAKLARMQSDNDSLFATIQDAEKIKREERNREDQLQIIWRKARRALEETKHAVRFEGGKPEIDIVPPERLDLADLVRIGGEAVALAESSSKLVRFRGSYLDRGDHLVEANLFRLGRVAVFAETSEGVKLLGPNGRGSLRVVEDDKGGSAQALLDKKTVGSVPVYLFESLQDRLTIKKPSGVVDQFADMIPILFLGMLFLMVAFLFAQLART